MLPVVRLCIIKRRMTEYAMGLIISLSFPLEVKYKLAPPVVETNIMFFPMRRNTGDSIIYIACVTTWCNLNANLSFTCRVFTFLCLLNA